MSVDSRNSRLPLPRISGNTISRYSSITPCGINEFSRSALPGMTMSPPSCSFSSRIRPTTSPSMIVVFCQCTSRSRFDTTYFGIELILSAKPPSLGADGQNASQIW